MSRLPAVILFSLAVAPLMLWTFGATARAALNVCNKTVHPASVAVGFFNGKAWSSTGWWIVAAGGCESVIKEPLNARYYYLYAAHQDVGGAWDGNRTFCVRRGRFQIEGRSDCLNQGYEMRRFFEVDTGDSADWTENLAD